MQQATLTPRRAALKLGITTIDCDSDILWRAVRLNSEILKIVESDFYGFSSQKNHVSKYSPPWRPPDINKENTYSGCVDSTLDLVKNQLRIELFDGDNMDGMRESRRCYWELEIPEECGFYKQFLEENVINELKRHALSLLEEYENKRRIRLMDAIFVGFFK